MIGLGALAIVLTAMVAWIICTISELLYKSYEEKNVSVSLEENCEN